MAPTTPINLWLDCLSTKSRGAIRLDERRNFQSVRMDDVLQGLAETQSEGKDLDEWLEKYHEYPLVLRLLPYWEREITPFHHVVRDTENRAWVGLGGVSTP
jgi:hypothetical protein